MRMRAILPVALLPLLLPLQVHAQDFEGKVSYRASMGGLDMEIVHFIKGQRSRQEMTGPMGHIVTITDIEAGKVAMFMPGQPNPMVMSMDQVRAMGGQSAPETAMDLTPTGQKETIAGYACEHYLVKQDTNEVDICAATGMGFFSGSMQGGMGGRGGGPPSLEMEKLRAQFKDGFFPLKISMTTPMGAMLMEVVTLERTSLSDDLFKFDGGIF